MICFRAGLSQLLLGALFLLSMIVATHAAPLAADLTTQDHADLSRIETYLDGVKTLSATFEQTGQDGATADGKVYLSRPGKMRFDYDPPAQMAIVSNGDYIAVDDKELKQVQTYPVESTPIWFLLREGIRLSGDVTVTKFEHAAKAFRVTCVQTKDPNSGSITLVFSDAPLTLRQWIVVDQQGKSTDVALNNVELGGTFGTDLFRLPTNPVQPRSGNNGR